MLVALSRSTLNSLSAAAGARPPCSPSRRRPRPRSGLAPLEYKIRLVYRDAVAPCIVYCLPPILHDFEMLQLRAQVPTGSHLSVNYGRCKRELSTRLQRHGDRLQPSRIIAGLRSSSIATVDRGRRPLMMGVDAIPRAKLVVFVEVPLEYPRIHSSYPCDDNIGR